MKRIIDGVAYNTKTAQLVARQGQDEHPEGSQAEKVYGKHGWTGRYQDVPVTTMTSLYRTKTGKFFFVEEVIRFPGENMEPVRRRDPEFEPVSYDTAYEFAQFEDVDVLVEGIFPKPAA
jgi:hypothetical protein